MPSLGPPDNYSERLLLIGPAPIRTRSLVGFPDIFSPLHIVGVAVAVFLRTSTFKGRDESSSVASRTAYSVIHTRSLSPVHSRARGYPRHPSWKKPPGTGAGFIYSPQRDFHVNLPRTFVTFPITDW